MPAITQSINHLVSQSINLLDANSKQISNDVAMNIKQDTQDLQNGTLAALIEQEI